MKPWENGHHLQMKSTHAFSCIIIWFCSGNGLVPNRPQATVWCNDGIQYIPRNMHTVFALLCFVVVIHWLIFPYPSGLLHWHCGNLTIAPVPAKQPWWIWINTSCEFIMNDCITTTKQSTTKPCAYFLGYTVVYSHINASLGSNAFTKIYFTELLKVNVETGKYNCAPRRPAP